MGIAKGLVKTISDPKRPVSSCSTAKILLTLDDVGCQYLSKLICFGFFAVSCTCSRSAKKGAGRNQF
jgi:hypothetical protein